MQYFISYQYSVQGCKGFRNVDFYYGPKIKSAHDIDALEQNIAESLRMSGQSPFCFGGVHVTILYWRPFEEGV